MSVIEDFSPIYVGDTEVPLAPQFAHADGSFVNLSGATITMKMQEATFGTVKVCSGTWTIDNAANGQAHYQWQVADVNTAGDWNLYITITIGGLPVHADFKPLQILPAP